MQQIGLGRSSDYARLASALDKEGKPRWPEYWTMERLEAERHSMGTGLLNLSIY